LMRAVERTFPKFTREYYILTIGLYNTVQRVRTQKIP